MKNVIVNTIKILFIILVIGWILLIIYDRNKYYENGEDITIKLSEETFAYDDFKVHVSYGLGYKTMTYLKDNEVVLRQFGNIFTQVQEELEE